VKDSVKTETYSIHGNTWNGQIRKQNQNQEMTKKINTRGYKKWQRKKMKHRTENHKYQ